MRARIAEQTRLAQLSLALTRKLVRARLAQIDRQIAVLDNRIAQVIAAQPETARTCRILCSIPGISTVTAAAILAELPEIGRLDRKQVAALAGLAPMTRQSGRWTGQAMISGGRKPLRQALYMPALVAVRHNPGLRVKFDDLTKRGKPGKLALTCIMRKLIELANALVRDNRTWTPNPA